VGAPAGDALGDGEAAAIAVAVSRGLDLVIDDRKARRIVRERFDQVRTYWTVDVLRAHRVVTPLVAIELMSILQRHGGSGVCTYHAVDGTSPGAWAKARP
jgi:hypothetical protein